MKKISLLIVFLAAIFMFASCLSDDGGVLSAKRTLTMPAEIANIPAGSTLAINIQPTWEIGWEDAPVEGVPFSNEYIEENYEEYFSINGGADIGLVSESPFRQAGVSLDYFVEHAEALFEYYLAGEKSIYFLPDPENPKSLYSTAPADFDYETWPYEPMLISGGEPLVPPFVMAEDPATADYTLDVYYAVNTKIYQVVNFSPEESSIKDYWDEDKRNLKQAGDLYMYYNILTNYKLIDNATGEVVCDMLTDQGDANIKRDTNPTVSGKEFLANTDDPASFLSAYDFSDRAVDFAIESVQGVIPRLRVLWYCNADDMTVIYPETVAE